MRRAIGCVVVIAVALGVGLAGQGRSAGRGATKLPVVVFETAKGTIEMELYPNEAPRSVEHILTLVKRNFYNGQRVHRVVPGFVVQFGDPNSRDMTKKALWGASGSGRAIGVAEISPKRPHKLGAVALAHTGNPRDADSQIYICLNGPQRYQDLVQGNYAVIGQVISGMDVVQKLQVPDMIKRASVKGPAPAK